MGYQPADFEQEAYDAVQSLLSQWSSTYFAKEETVAKTDDSSPGMKLPPLEWKYNVRHKGTIDRGTDKAVQFLTTWSQPAEREPVPRATASAWVTYRKYIPGDEKRLVTAPVVSLTYRYEHHRFSHKVPYPTTASSSQAFAVPSKGLPSLVTSKLQISDAIVNRKLLQRKTWREWGEEVETEGRDGDEIKRGSGDEHATRVNSPELYRISPWTRAAMFARDDMVRDAITCREQEREEGVGRPSIASRERVRPISAATLMNRSFLTSAEIAIAPKAPDAWKVETRNADAKDLRVEREKRIARRRAREERRTQMEEEAVARLQEEQERMERQKELEEEKEEEAERFKIMMETKKSQESGSFSSLTGQVAANSLVSMRRSSGWREPDSDQIHRIIPMPGQSGLPFTGVNGKRPSFTTAELLAAASMAVAMTNDSDASSAKSSATPQSGPPSQFVSKPSSRRESVNAAGMSTDPSLDENQTPHFDPEYGALSDNEPIGMETVEGETIKLPRDDTIRETVADDTGMTTTGPLEEEQEDFPPSVSNEFTTDDEMATVRMAGVDDMGDIIADSQEDDVSAMPTTGSALSLHSDDGSVFEIQRDDNVESVEDVTDIAVD
ncbi:hypothetical protein SpCBS45565_g02589 [Spizellomyces sp. 'palustris']|nr:hypothetical protein SpCBS45565_g02589 [Spizellomyces sp. 'palustris']